MNVRLIRRAAAFPAGLAILSTTGTAWGHHPMGGETPSTLWQGLLSGLGHPIIGLDHLAFIIAIGLLCAFAGLRSLVFPFLLVAATVFGAVLQWSGVTLAFAEFVVAASVITAGILLLRAPSRLIATASSCVFAAVFHGLAYGEAIIGSEPAPLAAYLLGFSLIQMVIAGLAYRAGQAALSKGPSALRSVRHLAGSVVGGIGLFAIFTALLA